ncbi:MAG: DNA-binding response regulator [Epulopiscium sp. Nele67-Bin004]|nr:MAG: DNA-binding response regulator [Epulopiscium sp. Nele67-Bin004]
MRILVVEDEPDLNDIITKTFCADGYSVDSAFDGEQALDYIQSSAYDAIILDVMLPKVDGFTVLQKVRAMHIDTPVIFLTAKDHIEDRVRGLDIGADDYLVKPFSFDELRARIRVMVRKTSGQFTNIIKVGDVQLDTSTKVVKVNDKPIDLSAKEYAILSYLMHNAGVILSRDQIELNVWGYDYDGVSNMIDVYIRYLRKKLGVPIIHTVRGRGYVVNL